MKSHAEPNTTLLADSLDASFFAHSDAARVLAALNGDPAGLSAHEAKRRLKKFGHNSFAKKRSWALEFFSKFTNPLMVVLLVVAVVSFVIGEAASGFIVLSMALISTVLTFWQEFRADQQAEKLGEMVHTRATVLRSGKPIELLIRDVTVGDIIELSAGDIIPADMRLIAAKDLFVNQASFTGEAFPVEKHGEKVTGEKTNPFEWSSVAFMGSAVVSGTATGVVFATGEKTQFGGIAGKLSQAAPETRFETSIKDFSMLMIRLMLVLVIVIFAINVVFKGNFFESLLFSLAVAVGLTPEMLPLVLTVNMSRGAQAMAQKKVIVKHLNSIQNFGSMDVLCTDKTGTLTLGEVVLERHFDAEGHDSEEVFHYAYINSFYQTGLKNLLDKAVLKHKKVNLHDYRKVDEIPYDFSRKMMSVVIERDDAHELVCKGAPEEVFARCGYYESNGQLVKIEGALPSNVRNVPERMRSQGFRVLAVARKRFDEKKSVYTKDDEKDLVLNGFVMFLDPPKPSARQAIDLLEAQHIELKVLTGDSELIAVKTCQDLDLPVKGTLTTEDIEKMDDDTLSKAVEATTVFARLTPIQKERIVRELRKNGHTVGYMGDGINDAPALKQADIGISVDNATDIAKEMADLILLEKSLMVLSDGVREGRKTFANVLKYVHMGASSNLGNMASVTGASVFLPFLPMAPIQILLNNFLYDFSQLALPTDHVDEEWLEYPIPWNLKHTQQFMLVLGPTSSVFDFLTFGVLLAAQAPLALFHTVWFLESLISQTLVIHVLRTRKIPVLESPPSTTLALTSIAIIAVGIGLVYSPMASAFGFQPPTPMYLLAIAGIVAAYLVTVFAVKNWFVKKTGSLLGPAKA